MTAPARAFVESLREAVADAEASALLAPILAELGATRTVHTTATLARELEVSERTIRRAVQGGELAATRRAGRWVMTVSDVEAWARSGSPSSAGVRAAAPRATKRRGGLAAALGIEDV